MANVLLLLHYRGEPAIAKTDVLSLNSAAAGILLRCLGSPLGSGNTPAD